MHIFLVKNVLFLLQKSNVLVTKTFLLLKGHPVTFGILNMTFKGHKYLKFRNLASCMSLPMFVGSGNPNMASILPYARSKVTLVTFRTLNMTFKTLNMTFKGHTYLKFRDLASCMSIPMFFGSGNPNMALILPYPRSKVTLVTFRTLNMTFKGHKY